MIALTETTIHSAYMDAAHSHCRKRGGSTWNEDDVGHACNVVRPLYKALDLATFGPEFVATHYAE